MARKQNKRIQTIELPTVEELQESGKYQAMLNLFNKNPKKWYEWLVVKEETDNTFTRSDNGTLLLQSLQQDINIDDDTRFEILTPLRISDSLKQKIDQHKPEDVYKQFFKKYTYGKDSLESKLEYRKVMAYATMKLLDKGVDPSELMRKTGKAGKAFKFVGNILNMDAQPLMAMHLKAMATLVPRTGVGKAALETLKQSGKEVGKDSSLWDRGREFITRNYLGSIAKIRGDVLSEEDIKAIATPLKMWDISLSERYMRNIGSQIRGDDKVLSSAMKKSRESVPLSSDEQNRIEKFNKWSMWAGIGAEIGLGLLLPGGVFKGLDEARNAAKADNIIDIAHTTAKTIKGEIAKAGGGLENVSKAMDDLLDMTTKTYSYEKIQDGLRIAENSFKGLDFEGAGKFTAQIGKARKGLADTIQAGLNAEKTLSKPIYKFTNSQLRKIRTVGNNLVKKIKFRKLYRASGVGLLESLTTSQRKLVESGRISKALDDVMGKGIKGGAKKVMDLARRMSDVETDKVIKSMENLNRNLSRAYGEIRGELTLDKFHSAIDDILENPDILGKYNPNDLSAVRGLGLHEDTKKVIDNLRPQDWQVLKQARRELDNFLIDEVKHGVSISPLGLSEADGKVWKKISRKFTNLWYENSDSSKLVGIETELRDLLLKSKGFNIMDEKLFEETTKNFSYLAHLLTEKGRKFVREKNLAGDKLTSFINDAKKVARKRIGVGGFEKRRFYTGSLRDINEGFRELLTKDKVKPEDLFDLFETNIAKIMGVRGQRHALAIKKTYFAKMIKQFGNEFKEAGMRALSDSVPDAVRFKGGVQIVDGVKIGKELYYTPDVAQAIENMFTMFRDDGNLFWKYFEKANRVWKRTTLAFPTTVIRNAIGNTFNSLLSMKLTPHNVATYVKSLGEAIGIWLKKQLPQIGEFLPPKAGGHVVKKMFEKAKVPKLGKGIKIGKGGRLISYDMLYDEALKRGLFSSGFQAAETTLKDLGTKGNVGKTIKRGGKVGWALLEGRPILAVNGAVEEVGRFALFITAVKQGKSFDGAADTVFKHLFDYGDLGKGDRAIKRALPFWTWTRKNVPLQLSKLMSDESRAIIRIVNSMQRGRPGDKVYNEEFMSEWLSETQKTLNLKKTKKTGRPHYNLMESMFPVFDIMKVVKLFETFKKDPDKAIGFSVDTLPIIKEIGRLVSPLLKVPIEIAFNKDFNFGTEIQKSKYAKKEFLGMRLEPKVVKWLGAIRLLGFLVKGGLEVDLGVRRTMTTPRRDAANAVVSYLWFAPYEYNRGFSKDMSTAKYNKQQKAELGNFRTWKYRLQNVGSMTQGDVDDMMKRAKQNLRDIVGAEQAGIITKRQRDIYVKWLYKILWVWE